MSKRPPVRHYDASYGQFASALHAQVRAAAFGRDIGQNGWLSAEEHDLFIQWLGLDADSRLLDVACGAGHPTLRIAELTGARVDGVELHEQGVAVARLAAAERGLAARASFLVADAAQRLPFEDASFDALICVDAVNHLPDRAAVFGEWARVLQPGGRLVFTDPIVVSGPLTNEEIAIRSSIGFFLFVPPRLRRAPAGPSRLPLDRSPRSHAEHGRHGRALARSSGRARRRAASRGRCRHLRSPTDLPRGDGPPGRRAPPLEARLPRPDALSEPRAPRRAPPPQGVLWKREPPRAAGAQRRDAPPRGPGRLPDGPTRQPRHADRAARSTLAVHRRP